jgi:hypothetical protein
MEVRKMRTEIAMALTMALAVGCGGVAPMEGAPDAGSGSGSGMMGSGSGSGMGSGSGSGSGSGMGSGSDMGSGSGGCTGGCPGPTLAVVSATVKDERGDVIDFSSGDPIHEHQGPEIDLGGTGCPDVYMYPYLMDASAPPWGGEASANPLAWQLKADAPAGLAEADYRVRADSGAVLLDWTAATGGVGGAFAVTLHRSGDHGIAQLGTRAQGLTVDVRALDTQGLEADASYCIKFHPLAAPLEIKPIAKESASDLWGMTLAADSPISHLINAGAPPTMIGQRFIQHTAEPITLDLSVGMPAAAWTKAIANHFVVTASGTQPCGTTTEPSSDPRCNSAPNVTDSDTSASGALASGTWAAAVIDEATGDMASACTIAGLHASCAIPPRAAGAAPHAYRIVTYLDGVTDLAPGNGTIAEYALLGRTYTGLASTSIQKCKTRAISHGSISCAWATYAHFIALDRATLAFQPFTTAYATSVGADVPTAAIPYTAPLTSAALTWDSGIDVLPGQ